MEQDQKNKPNNQFNRFSFVPFRLIIPDRPELAYFARNILMGRFAIWNGRLMFANVLYEPDLDSFSRNESAITIFYHNPLDKESWIKLTVLGDKYELVKYFRNERVGASFGVVRGTDDKKGWSNFFLHVGILGFAKGETVNYDNLQSRSSH